MQFEMDFDPIFSHLNLSLSLSHWSTAFLLQLFNVMVSFNFSIGTIAYCFHSFSLKTRFRYVTLLELLGISHYLARLTVAAGNEYEYERQKKKQCDATTFTSIALSTNPTNPSMDQSTLHMVP